MKEYSSGIRVGPREHEDEFCSKIPRELHVCLWDGEWDEERVGAVEVV